MSGGASGDPVPTASSIMAFVARQRVRLASRTSAVIVAAALVWLSPADPASQTPSSSYTMYYGETRRTLVVRTTTTPEMLALEQLAGVFSLTFTEDRSANGLVIGTKGDRILAFPGQAFVRAAGRVVALAGPVQRDRSTWLVPLDFLTKALGPAIGEPIVVRRSSRLILVGNVRVPEVSAKIERTNPG